MSLKLQLFLVALISLVLPWAGLNYVRETELALRANQQALLASLAEGIATTLQSEATAIPQTAPGTLYVERLSRAPRLDGYRADWSSRRGSQILPSASTEARLAAGAFADRLYFYLETDGRAQTLQIIGYDANDQLLSVDLDVSQPGSQSQSLQTATLNAYVEVTNRTRIEWVLPREMFVRGAGVTLVATDGTTLATSFASTQPPAPIMPVVALELALRRYEQPGTTLHATNSDGWIVARAAGAAANLAAPVETTAGLFFRRILRSTGEAVAERSIAGGRDRNDWVSTALEGTTATQWVTPANDEGLASMIAAVPLLRADGRTTGALVLRRSASARLLSSSQALSRLAALTLLATFGTGLALVLYAAWLSLRIRRLAQAADAALTTEGGLQAELPDRAASDEVGSLARSFGGLLERVRDYHDYLQTLSARLSHELNTPLSIVSSSLENLGAETLSADQARYAERAHDGIQRMRSLVRTMSEATRVEQSASAATRETFDLAAMLQQLAQGYSDSLAPQKIETEINASEALVFGAPSLIVQALDKFVSNAASFARAETPIKLTMEETSQQVIVGVENIGPILTTRECIQVFDSLVSLRDGGKDGHLGFGLYIARLIAEAHGGSVAAAPLAARNGMRFSLVLPTT